jgi:hypothetical protein
VFAEASETTDLDGLSEMTALQDATKLLASAASAESAVRFHLLSQTSWIHHLGGERVNQRRSMHAISLQLACTSCGASPAFCIQVPSAGHTAIVVTEGRRKMEAYHHKQAMNPPIENLA